MFDSNGKSNDGNYNQLRQHFPRVVHEIQRELNAEQERFFEQNPLIQSERENLGTIYPYRLNSEADCRCIQVDTVTVDTSVKEYTRSWSSNTNDV